MSKKSKKTNIKGEALRPKELKKHILFLFKKNPRKRFNPRQIIKKLKINNTAPSVHSALEQLCKENLLIEAGEFKYRINKYTSGDVKVETYEGIVDMTLSGAAFVTCEDLSKDVYVSMKNLNSALNGDKVRLVVTKVALGKKPEGVITEIIERASESFIGTIQVSKNYAFVIPDISNMHMDIFIPIKEIKEAKNGDKVVVKITEWNSAENKSPVGKVTAVLSGRNKSDLAMKTILINNGFDWVFPDNVNKEAEALSTEITEEEIQKRRDLREVTTFTIDPLTAKDFDDALSIQYLENGHCEIGVHIADVSHYLKEDTLLDKEAITRSTSVYLVDRVAPMLPEKLSNELCSLRPNEDKLTFSAIFEFDKNDKIVNRWLGRTVTHSDRRFTYEEAQEILEAGEGDFAPELKAMNRIAKVLRKAKFKNGAIAFEAEEVKFKLDEEGTPLYVYTKERKDAHMLIEDFMLLANREVATFIIEKGKNEGKEIPFPYRIHDSPDPGKLADFALYAKQFGYHINTDTPRSIANSLNKLAKDAREKNELRMLEPMAIRTMSKAEYSTNNIGHYGLAFNNYTHFTSPIRRYSDVLVHRLLDKNLNDNTFRTSKDTLEAQCKHISKQERKAMAAERESIKYKQVEFISNQIGNTFKGMVSGMIDKGLFVELVENKCEGFIPFNSLEDNYRISEGRMKAVSTFGNKTIKIGDILNVIVVKADIEKRQIELDVV